jgi:hypothetical protein
MTSQAEIEQFASDWSSVEDHTPPWSSITYPAIQHYSPQPHASYQTRLYAHNASSNWFGRLELSAAWGSDAQNLIHPMLLDYDSGAQCLVGHSTAVLLGNWTLDTLKVYKTASNKILDVLLWTHPTHGYYVTSYIWPRR